MYSSPGYFGPHGHIVPTDHGPLYPWHLVYIEEGVGITMCDTTGQGVHGIVLPENKQVVKDADATECDNYFTDGEHCTIEDREHIQTLVYTGGVIAIYSSVMTDGLGRAIQWVGGNLYMDCGISLQDPAGGPDELIWIHFHPAGAGAGHETDSVEAQA